MRLLFLLFVVASALAAVLAAAAALAAPGAPPPNVAGTSGEPPPAWLGAGGREQWLAYSSFCWATTCVDFLPPARRTDLPKVVARRGTRISIHLRFVPTWVRVRMLATGKTYGLVARRDTSWRVRGSGVVSVEVRAAKGTASYLARIAG